MSKFQLENHPCFNAGACKTHGRVHLPVAPKCNIQCKYCNRAFDCVNESRPGVCSDVLSPKQAGYYFDKVVRNKPIAVMGIAGPGDPFANEKDTMETLRLTREKYPDMMLCIATNGLNLYPYIDELVELKVSHVTITMNAVDPEIGKELYSWVRFNKKVYRGKEAAEILLEQQKKSILKLAKNDMLVKINTVVVKGVNDHHLKEISLKAKEWGADVMNAMSMIPVPGAEFENKEEIDLGEMLVLRSEITPVISQISHCKRCRADAVGLLGEKNSLDTTALLKEASNLPLNPEEERECVAVGSREGMLINRHLGESPELFIYKKEGNEYQFFEKRELPPPGAGDQRWLDIANVLKDCSDLLVSGLGIRPQNVLTAEGIKVHIVEGVADQALKTLAMNGSLRFMQKKGAPCSGGKAGGGCV